MELSIKERYSRAYVQVLEIIKHMGKEYEEKIPKNYLALFEKNKDKNYQYSIDPQKNLEEQNLLRETLGILSVIELKYWATSKEKANLSKALKFNEIEYQYQLHKKYNPDNMFKNTNNSLKNDTETNLHDSTITEYKEKNFIQKLFNKIKHLFIRKS